MISAHGCLAQLARASALHAEGQGFESLNIHHEILLACAKQRRLKKFQCRAVALFKIKDDNSGLVAKADRCCCYRAQQSARFSSC